MKIDRLHKVLACIALMSLACTVYIGVKENYHQRLAAKFGYEYHRMDWAVYSWASCLKKLNHHSDIVFFGDSITRGGDFHLAFPEKSIANLGLSGDTLTGMTDRAGMIESLTPSKVFVMAGVNGMSTESAVQYKKLIQNIKNASNNRGGVEIYVQSLLPIEKHKEGIFLTNNSIRNLNIELKKICETLGVTFIDLYPMYEKDGHLKHELSKDGVHINEEAYKIWYEAIRMFI